MSERISYPSLADFPTKGNSYTEYLALDTSKTYGFNISNNTYVEIVSGGSTDISSLSTETTLGLVKTAIESVNTRLGATNVNYEIDPTVNAPISAFIKGLISNTNDLNTISNQIKTSVDYTVNNTGGANVHLNSIDTKINTLGAISDVAVTNPLSDGTQIALSKGILSQTVDIAGKDFATQTTLSLVKTNTDGIATTNTNTGTTATNTTNLVTAETNQTATGNITTQDVTSSGTGTAGSYVGFTNLSNKTLVACQINGLSVATGNARFQVSLDGNIWKDIGYMDSSLVVYNASTNISLNGNQLFFVQTHGVPYFRIHSTGAVTGSAPIILNANPSGTLVTSLLSGYSANGGTSGNVTISGTASVNISQIGSNGINSEFMAPSGHSAMPVTITGSLAVASTTGTSVNTSSSAILSTADGAQSLAIDLIITAWNGTGSIDFVLQESLDGTNYTDIWHFTRVTGNGTYKMPSMPICGYRKLVWTVNGTVTTATLARHLLAHNNDIVKKRQFFDRTSALLAGTTGAGTTYNISGCKIVNAAMLASAVVSGATYQLEVSSDGTNFYKVGTAKQLTTANELLQLDGLTNNTYNFARINCTVGVVTSQTGVYGLITGSN